MKSYRILSALTMLVTLGMAASLQAGTCSADAQASACSAGKTKNLVAVAKEAGSFNTLVAAIQAAGLADTLQGKGPFTVFAPTDAAFAKLPAGTVENLLKPENRDKLVAILTYHVVPGKVTAAEVKTSQPKTVNGQKVSIKVGEAGVTVAEAKVVKTDVLASNGVIHVIDSVIIPQS